jgi:hypothetical protein
MDAGNGPAVCLEAAQAGERECQPVGAMPRDRGPFRGGNHLYTVKFIYRTMFSFGRPLSGHQTG